MTVTRKTEVATLNATPSKRMFWSLMTDYVLATGLCELIDNAIDLWMRGPAKRRPAKLRVALTLDADRQTIAVEDNAGGVAREDLQLLIAPGGSNNDPDARVIGIFGVGGKRATVALGERVEIRTRHGKGTTHQVDLTAEWLKEEDWEIAAYEIPEIAPGTTRIDISNLTRTFDGGAINDLRAHFGETYARFIESGCEIVLNGARVEAVRFDNWAYPAGHGPKRAAFQIASVGEAPLDVVITAGLITDRAREHDNYGVYLFCNDRLIVKELRSREVGYVSGIAGVPHADASLCRVIVELSGPAQRMPWNSSKSGINTSHDTFKRIAPPLVDLVAHFSSLSRRLKNDWDRRVFARNQGTVEDLPATQLAPGNRLHLPPLPRVRKRQVDHVKARNRAILRDSPWTLGLVEALSAVDVIQRQRFDTRNRIAIILLDSNFEIALKEFIVHRTDLFPKSTYNDAKIATLFKNRPSVIAEVRNHVALSATLVARVDHYYQLRNKFIHERATVDVTDSDVKNYRSTIHEVLRALFGLRLG